MEEYKFYLAKKFISIATKCNGYVYGEFVRDVIIPRLNDPECDILFNNIDIWFKKWSSASSFHDQIFRYFLSEVNLYYQNKFKKDQSKYTIIRRSNNEILFSINVTFSDDFPRQNFDVNYLRYQYHDGFVMSGYGFSQNNSSDSPIFKQNINKVVVMSSNYNPTTEEEFNQINKDYFQKGWSIITDKQGELSKWIVKNNIPVTIGIEDGLWVYSPKKEEIKIYVPSLRIAGTEEDIKRVSKLIYPDYSDEHINDLIKNANNNKPNVNSNNANNNANNINNKPKWSRDMIEQDARNNRFTDVGKKRLAHRFLSGAPRVWTSPDLKKNEIVYILPLRICGTHNDIRETLKSAEPPYTENEIDNYLRNAISKYNYQTTKANEYNQEIADFKSKRKNTKWSRDLIRPFTKNKSFVIVNCEKISRIGLSEAPQLWSSSDLNENMSVYILPLRICGTPDNIRKVLNSAEPPYSEEEIENYLKDAITKDNYQTTKADEYNKEIGNILPDIFKLTQKITNDLRNSNIISPNNTNFNTILFDLIKDISDKPKDDKPKEKEITGGNGLYTRSGIMLKEADLPILKENIMKSLERNNLLPKNSEDKPKENNPRKGFLCKEADEIPVLKTNIMRIVGGDSFYPRNLDDKPKDTNVLYLRKEDESKAVMRSIFSAGLESLSKKFNNDTENKELQYIYKCGLDQYSDKFNDLIKDM